MARSEVARTLSQCKGFSLGLAPSSSSTSLCGSEELQSGMTSGTSAPVGRVGVGIIGATLPDNEVEALKEIGDTLGKKDWNFSVDPCSGDYGWAEASNMVTCNCSYVNNTICHVVSIDLIYQNLDGILPPELVKLPYLQAM
ncbi:Leucine-rich repeat transmembrane protein kinase [Thalictrum thalictroides]|uniref:Leucine-rich repeat transmembrane protein kinase n=1 Tax=Thalictrum thalictroides TaxID=46969 RepID=A0A7J6WRB5_THATH|nr:Leucine-rich repeat transmembrane protein kinase [Thalictrum thalictroides]